MTRRRDARGFAIIQGNGRCRFPYLHTLWCPSARSLAKSPGSAKTCGRLQPRSSHAAFSVVTERQDHQALIRGCQIEECSVLLSVRKHLVDARTFFAPGTVHARVPQGSWSRCFERRRNRHRPHGRRRYIETPLPCGCADRPHHKRDMFGRCPADRRQQAKHGFPMPDIRSVASPADTSKGRRLCESSYLWLATCLALIHSS